MKTPFWFLTKNPIALVLLPLATAYYFASKIIFVFRSFCKKYAKQPVICVGGILAGGVGKTPLVREIAKYLDAPVVMRGYKGTKRRGQVKSFDSAEEVGDEAKMLAQSGLKVYVGDRVENTDLIGYSAPAIVMDDGFQNPVIHKDLSILAFDESVGTGNGFLLPAGPLRETIRSGIRRADAIIVGQSESGRGCRSVINLAKKRKKVVFFAKKELDKTGLVGKFVAFAGIGYPDKFFDALRQVPMMRVVKKIPFPDHHQYSNDDLVSLFSTARAHGARLVCTEKDWVKLPSHIQAKVRFAKQITILPAGFWKWLDKKLLWIRNKDRLNVPLGKKGGAK